MPTTNTDRRYGSTRAWLHWAIALIVVVMIASGLVMARTLDDATRLGLYRVHLVIGWTVVALSLWRFVLRLRRRVSAPPATLPVDQARAGHQVGAYAFSALLVVHVAGIVRHQVRFGNALAPMRPVARRRH